MDRAESPPAPVKNEAKVVQIIPAERGWHVAGYEVPEDREPIRWFREVACWALMSDGTTLPMIADDGGRLYPAVSVSEKLYETLELYSPVQSFSYLLTEGANEPDGDWELCGTAAATGSDGSAYIFSWWRQPHHDS